MSIADGSEFSVNESQTMLTNRQLESSCLVALGMTDKEIARLLRIDHYTVKAHVNEAKHRLGVKSRPALVCQLWLRGIIKLSVAAWLGLSPIIPDDHMDLAQRLRGGGRRGGTIRTIGLRDQATNTLFGVSWDV